MVKSGLGLFAGRRKSSGNAVEEAEPMAVPEAAPGADSGSGGFRLMSTAEAEARKREEKRRAQEKAASKFRPFSGFSAGGKGRNHSFDEESPASSKRDSKSSNGTQSSRYYNGQFGSTSTLPSSADTDSNDNIFAVPRPHITQHSSSPSSLAMGAGKKQLPAIPKSESRAYGEPTSPTAGLGRVRAMTSSSYASTAKPPTLDADLNFGSSSFDDLFSGLDRKPSPDYTNESPGRSLLDGKRTFHAEPIKIDRTLDVEAPPKSWDSRGSADNLMPSPRSPDSDSPPPPVPLHKYSSHGQYAPVASHSPEPNGSNGFEDTDAKIVRQSVISRKSVHEGSPEQLPPSLSSSAPSLQTPLSSRSTSNNTTPKAALRPAISPLSEDEDDIFSPPKQREAPAPKPAPAAPTPKENRPAPPASAGDSGRKVMTQAEFREQQQRQMMQPQEESSDEEDYEDEEDAEEKAQQEAIARRKKQQMDLARETMRRTTTAPARPESMQEPFTMGFPSETSLQADEWEDEDIPLGILAQHGFPSKDKGKVPTQPANAIPSYFRSSTPLLPERPASAEAMSNRASQAFRPVFARNLPEDPHASFIGGGLVRPSNRESIGMGFNSGPASVAGEPAGGMSMSMPMMAYPEPQLSAPSLVEQIHMRDMTKQKYMGGASSKKPQQGPFTGLLGAQMNGPNQKNPQTRMSQIPMMNGMSGMSGMNGMGPMNMNMMGVPMGMPMMGMNQMAYPMQNNELMHMQQMQQMQQMLAAQQFQMQQMQAAMSQQQQQQQQPQDPRMSMINFPTNNFNNNGFLNVPAGGPASQRPMSLMSPSTQPPRPYSTGSPMHNGFQPAPPLLNGYTPSIAPSERSNIGLSARYRPVATHQDTTSTVSSMTLQASKMPAVKGILKNKGAAVQEEDDDDDGWGKMAQRKSKFIGNGFSKDASDGDLRELVRGVDGL